MFSFKGWGIYAVLAALLAFACLAWSWESRGRDIRDLNAEIDGLRLELSRRTAEVERLEKAANALGRATQKQGVVLSADLARREKINEMMATCSLMASAAEPSAGAAAPAGIKEVINEKTSRQALAFINSDLLSPLGGGLRRAPDPAGEGQPGLVPGPAGAGALEAPGH